VRKPNFEQHIEYEPAEGAREFGSNSPAYDGIGHALQRYLNEHYIGQPSSPSECRCKTANRRDIDDQGISRPTPVSKEYWTALVHGDDLESYRLINSFNSGACHESRRDEGILDRSNRINNLGQESCSSPVFHGFPSENVQSQPDIHKRYVDCQEKPAVSRDFRTRKMSNTVLQYDEEEFNHPQRKQMQQRFGDVVDPRTKVTSHYEKFNVQNTPRFKNNTSSSDEHLEHIRRTDVKEDSTPHKNLKTSKNIHSQTNHPRFRKDEYEHLSEMQQEPRRDVSGTPRQITDHMGSNLEKAYPVRGQQHVEMSTRKEPPTDRDERIVRGRRIISPDSDFLQKRTYKSESGYCKDDIISEPNVISEHPYTSRGISMEQGIGYIDGSNCTKQDYRSASTSKQRSGTSRRDELNDCNSDKFSARKQPMKIYLGTHRNEDCNNSEFRQRMINPNSPKDEIGSQRRDALENDTLRYDSPADKYRNEREPTDLMSDNTKSNDKLKQSKGVECSSPRYVKMSECKQERTQERTEREDEQVIRTGALRIPLRQRLTDECPSRSTNRCNSTEEICYDKRKGNAQCASDDVFLDQDVFDAIDQELGNYRTYTSGTTMDLLEMDPVRFVTGTLSKTQCFLEDVDEHLTNHGYN